ncbi:TetR/AcrR family transcriptional regulator [Tuberibacillus calidus]|jgi:AcrR family transcriptional regulator|uniref:TetR/AcrR family transcriptional regulator n=1 Tax=Tuberibacillus calidus TaxID=340097 RepID=UPI00040E30BF|nr:TetR/AcrR family transcriptional regulator [Tuberibacillus calidus]
MKKTAKRPPGRPPLSETDTPKDQMILDTATRLFIDLGYKNVSVDEIAEACGVTKATVYYYFESKSNLFTEAMVRMMKHILEKMIAILAQKKPLKERLYEVILAHLKATQTIDIESFLRESETALTPEERQRMKRAEDELYEVIGKTIAEEMPSRLTAGIHPMFASQALVSLLKVGHYTRQDGKRLFQSPEEAAQTIVDFYWNGMCR